MTRPTLLATKHALDPARYADARELIEQAALDLTRLDPDDSGLGDIVILAHLARAALDYLAEDATTPAYSRPARTWDDLGRAMGLTPKQAKHLVAGHLDSETPLTTITTI